MPTVQIQFGAMCKPINEQLEEQGVCSIKNYHIQRDADAVTRLLVRGLISEAAAHSARRKIAKAIDKHAKTAT